MGQGLTVRTLGEKLFLKTSKHVEEFCLSFCMLQEFLLNGDLESVQIAIENQKVDNEDKDTDKIAKCKEYIENIQKEMMSTHFEHTYKKKCEQKSRKNSAFKKQIMQ